MIEGTGWDRFDNDGGWDSFLDRSVGRASDRAMQAVDAETVDMFRKYKLRMPKDFARACPAWERPSNVEMAPAAKAPVLSESAQDYQRYLNQSIKDRAEVNEAILATDARRVGATPPDYYRVRTKKEVA